MIEQVFGSLGGAVVALRAMREQANQSREDERDHMRCGEYERAKADEARARELDKVVLRVTALVNAEAP